MKPMIPLYIAIFVSISLFFMDIFVNKKSNLRISYILGITALVVSIIAVVISVSTPFGI